MTNVRHHGYMKDIFPDEHYLVLPMGKIAGQPLSGELRAGRTEWQANKRIDPKLQKITDDLDWRIHECRTYLASREVKMLRGKGRIRIVWGDETIGSFYPKTYDKWTHDYKAKFWESIVGKLGDDEYLRKYNARRIKQSGRSVIVRRLEDAERSLRKVQDT